MQNKNKIIIGSIIMLIISLLLSLRESNEEKILRIINEYNEQRNLLINYNSGVILSNKETIKSLEATNKILSSCIDKLEIEKDTIITPSCSTSSIITKASANMEEGEEEGENSSPFPAKNLEWRVNSKGQSKSRKELCGTEEKICSFESVAKAYSLPIETFIKNEKKWGVYKEIVLCIARADSGLGKYLKSKNNIGNVGNNDRGDVVEYATLDDGIEAIFRVLNGRFLDNKQSIGSLSPGGGGNSPFYATSKENWNINVLNCLNTISDVNINEGTSFRLPN